MDETQMKNISKLLLLSTLLTTATVQSASIGTYAAGGLFGTSETSGGIDQSTASVQGSRSLQVVPGFGTLGAYSYRAEAGFDTNAFAPVLRAEAIYDRHTDASDDWFISAEASAFQVYQNTSSTSNTYTISLNLHGIVDSSPSSFIDADFFVYSGANVFADSTLCGSTANSLNDLGYACGSQIASEFGGSGSEISGNGETTVPGIASFTVGAGEFFTVYGSLEASTFGGSADAFGTFTMKFEDNTDLLAVGQVSAVPLPAAAWLFISGLIGIATFARRKATV
ncbi:MAG: hypothetical protein DIZ80_04510 [endosymbiont of Galathealinum brachiosum]|uniref:VPLPA-CTERM sorting domain-containing protein n=1 Tax=endosymbiont of Galathealinum brachiosum TaxID=2200906 RepID=A0A370DK24_9GAMM|nr:MAG: hypothetical protein DIZ80_04510 [endosymbiont of Galathealinum brachiosum]